MAGLNGAEERVDEGLMSLDFNRICRLCLNFCRDYVDLRPSNGTQGGPRHIIDQIKYCYSIKIDLTEPLPSKICLQCIQILTLLGATKRNIKYSEMMLKNILSIRNAHRMINAQNRHGVNLAALRRFSSDNHQREQESPVAQDRPTQDNIFHRQNRSPIQNLRISPIQITTMQELYRIQDQTMQDIVNRNSQTSLNQSAENHGVKKNIENRRRKAENARAVENKPIKIRSSLLKPLEIKQDISCDTDSNSVKRSSSGPSCKTSTNSTNTDKNVSKTTKTIEGDKMKNANRKSNVVSNINKKMPFEIDMKRELKVKLEVLDLKNTKLYRPPSTDGLSDSTEGQNGGTSGESRSGKAVKEIGTVIDESNILSPKVKRMRKSIPKGLRSKILEKKECQAAR